MAAAPPQEHIELLRLFLTHRGRIVEGIEALLNAQRKPVRYRSLLADAFEDCFSTASPGQRHLRAELEDAHWASGFRPRQVQHVHNDLIDPVELMTRALHCWHQTKWPGPSDRTHYAHTLFNLYIVRWLQFLIMRLWDESPNAAGARLAEVQRVLDEIWRTSPAGQPAIVRDARWLIPLTLSLITDELAPYFEVVQHVTDTLPEADALEIQKAHVRMLGGHLTSQIRHYATRDNVPIGDPNIVVGTRTANALDLALLIQGLVALLKAYNRAVQSGDERARLEMAGAIFQGVSPDPELFLNRIDLLRAYSMIQHVFIATDGEGHATYSPAGQRHMQLLEEYEALISRLKLPLREELPRFKPAAGGCSPFGILSGLPTNLIEHMALKAIERDAETRFSLEDVFNDDSSAAKLEWVNGWRKLPHVPREVQRAFDYPQQFAENIYHRIEQEFARGDSTAGRLHIASGSTASELPAKYKLETSNHADRREGHYLVSYGSAAIKKDLLTEVLGAGQDTKVDGLPPDAVEVLRLMLPASLIATPLA